MKETIIAILILILLLVLGNSGTVVVNEIDWTSVKFSYEDATKVAESLK